MASELLRKRLLRQAGVSVLAGLLMSSAALAEDMTDGATSGDGGDVSVEAGIDSGFDVDSGGEPDVAVDPVVDETGEVPDITVDFGWERDLDSDGVVGEEGDLAEDGEVSIDPVDGETLGLGSGGTELDCPECDGGVPDVVIDPIETDGVEVTVDQPDDFVDVPVEAYQSVGSEGPGAPEVRGETVSHQDGRGRGRDGDLPVLRRLIVE